MRPPVLQVVTAQLDQLPVHHVVQVRTQVAAHSSTLQHRVLIVQMDTALRWVVYHQRQTLVLQAMCALKQQRVVLKLHVLLAHIAPLALLLERLAVSALLALVERLSLHLHHAVPVPLVSVLRLVQQLCHQILALRVTIVRIKR